MTSGTSVPLEDDIAALVNGQAVILVHDSTKNKRQQTKAEDPSSSASPVLNGEIRCAAIEAIGIVSSGLAITLAVGLVSRG